MRGRNSLLLLLGAELHDRVADRVDGQEGQREAGALHLVAEDELLDRRAPLAAVLLRPADADPAVGAHLLQRLLIERSAAALAAAVISACSSVGHHRGEVRPQVVAQLLLFGCVVEIHSDPRSVGKRSRPRRNAARKRSFGYQRRDSGATVRFTWRAAGTRTTWRGAATEEPRRCCAREGEACRAGAEPLARLAKARPPRLPHSPHAGEPEDRPASRLTRHDPARTDAAPYEPGQSYGATPSIVTAHGTEG